MLNRNVLHLIDSAGLYGAERVVLTLLEELRGTNFPGILGCIREEDKEVPVIAKKAQSLDVPIVYFSMQKGLNLFGIRRLYRFIKDNNIRIVHSHGYKPNILLFFIAQDAVRTISTVHGWAKKTAGVKMSLYEYLDAQALKRMDCTVAVSSDVAGNLISRGLKEEKIRVVHNGLKVCDITQHIDKNRVRENYGIAPDIMTFGTLGRLARIKGHEVLIRAMPSIVREIGACKLVIGGDGPLNNYLEELVKDLHLEDYVSMVGYVQNVGEFLSMIDVFILPSLSEGLPISLLEAMASGKPVVASSVGGITEVITTSEQGALVVPGDPVVIARAVTELLRDPARMKKMGAEGRQVIRERFSAEIMAKNYLNLYSTMYYDA